jgi:hypothetical protein
MARADAFLGFLFERHGTGVTLRTNPVEVRASASFFEAELLHASMTRKPILIARARGFAPNAALSEFLRLVTASLGPRIVEVDRHSLPDLFDDYCRAIASGPHDEGVWLFDRVSAGRVRGSVARELDGPNLRFLGGALDGGGPGVPDAGVISAALERVEAGSASDGRPLGQLERLTYLWAALKELAKGSAEDRENALRPDLERTLQRWSSSAAWYGLHGSHPMGCLASLNELTTVRLAAGSGEPPLGPRSSAYYSIGAQLRSRSNARHFFRLSLSLSHRALASAPLDPSGLLQMSASAQARLSKLGEPWRYLRALEDFRTSCEWRERHSSSQVAIGEAMNAYAYALFRLPWRRRDALRLAEEATSLLLSGREGAAGGMFLRGEHKRAEMLWRAGRVGATRRSRSPRMRATRRRRARLSTRSGN